MSLDPIRKAVHDLRTPLNAIAGYAEMLLEENDPETQQRYARTIRRAAAQMEDILSQLSKESTTPGAEPSDSSPTRSQSGV